MGNCLSCAKCPKCRSGKLIVTISITKDTELNQYLSEVFIYKCKNCGKSWKKKT